MKFELHHNCINCTIIVTIGSIGTSLGRNRDIIGPNTVKKYSVKRKIGLKEDMTKERNKSFK